MKAYVPSTEYEGKKYHYAATQLVTMKYNLRVVEMVFIQLTLKAAFKMWGNDAKIAAESEMKQLH
jgi:hypothetical protein